MTHRNQCTLNVMHQSRELAVYCCNLRTTFHQLLRIGFLQTSVANASKSLSEAEQNYANIERKLLGAVFAIETF